MSGSSGQGVHTVARDNSSYLSATDDQNISSLLSSSVWNGTNITFSFPNSSADYGTQATYGDPAPFNGFAVLTGQQQGEVLRAFSLISSYTNETFQNITETTTTHAAIRLANSSSPATSYAYYPSTAPVGGDVFYGGTGQNPVMGNFDSGQAILHEIGHSLGLKHGQDNNTYGVMNANRLDIEFSLMNYANYIGSTEGFATAAQSAQSYMMYDIAAFQYMYGANFSQVGHNNTYTWSATTGTEFINGVSQGIPVDNHIFETIWTEGANSTYDLSNFSQNQVDNMNAGGWMDFSTNQLADLNAFAPSKPQGEIFARADIYNALEYSGDSRSLIDNIITGSGDDTIIGNAANNVVDGGGGTNTFVETGNHTNYNFRRLNTGYIQITDLRSGSPDGTDQIKNIQKVQFADGTYTISQLLPAPLHAAASDFNGDGISDVLVENNTGNVTAFLMNNSAQILTAIGEMTLPSGWTIQGIGDFNGDGTNDILARNANGDVSEFLMNNSGQLQSVVGVSAVPTNWNIVGIGDYNGDGVSDILWENSTGNVSVFLMNSSGHVQSSVGVTTLPSDWHIVGTGDFNGDGTSDVLLENNSGNVSAFLMNHNAQIQSVVGITTLPSNWHVEGVGDFNGDGISDILVRNDNGDVSALLMNNSGHIQSVVGVAAVPTDWTIAAIGDFNGDGISDILWHNTNGNVSAFLMDSNGHAQTSVGVTSLPSNWAVIAPHNPIV
jgi:DNA/RNA endonuclease YhcR with UshA esterase domain